MKIKKIVITVGPTENTVVVTPNQSDAHFEVTFEDGSKFSESALDLHGILYRVKHLVKALED